MAKFEDYSKELDSLLKSAEQKWGLNLPSVSYEDIAQIIRLHIYNKFYLWDFKKAKFATWAKKVISNQITNLKKKYYLRFCSPCFHCKFNQGGDACARNPSGKKNEECKEFLKWSKGKSAGQNINFAQSLDEKFEDNEETSKIQVSGDLINMSEATARLHELMLGALEDKLHKFYTLRYIEGHGDDLIALAFGFTTTEEGRAPGYRQIYNMEAEIKKLAHFILSTQDIF